MAVQTMPWTGADGVAATTGNTGFTSIIKTSASSTIEFESSVQFRGQNSILNTGTADPGYSLGVLDFSAPTDTIAWEQHLRIVALPSGEQALLSFHESTDSRQWSLVLFANGSLAVRDDGATALWTGTGASPAGTLSTGVDYLLRVYVKRHATAGEFRVQILNASDAVIANGDTGLRTAQNTGAAAITHAKATSTKTGSSSTVTATYYWGVPRYDEAATGLIVWPPEAHQPAWMWIGGEYVAVDLIRWNGSAYVSALD